MLKMEESAGHSLPNLQSPLIPRLEPSGVANQPRAICKNNCTGPPQTLWAPTRFTQLIVDFSKVINVT